MKFSMIVQKTEIPQSPLTPPITTIPEEPITAMNDSFKKNTPLLRSISCKAKTPLQSHAYLKNLRFRRNSISHRGAMLNLHKYKMKASSCPDLFKNSMATLRSNEEAWYEEFVNILKDLTNFSLFLDLHFLLLSLSTMILFIWFIVPYFYLAEHMSQSGYTSSEAAFAISLIGITNTLGMVILGWVGDRLNIAKSYAICLVLCGASVGAILLFTKYYIGLLISSASFGIFFASCLSLTPSLIAELVSLDDFTMAYGLILLCQGIGNLTGPPLAGWLFDLTQSWDQSFYQAAFWIIISGLLIGVIPYTRNRKITFRR